MLRDAFAKHVKCDSQRKGDTVDGGCGNLWLWFGGILSANMLQTNMFGEQRRRLLVASNAVVLFTALQAGRGGGGYCCVAWSRDVIILLLVHPRIVIVGRLSVGYIHARYRRLLG